MHITLYRKYRPTSFEEVAGEVEIVKVIKNSLKNNKLSHAYLFTGPRGVGKTTTARLIAMGANCLTNGITDTPCGTCENCQAVTKGSFIDLIEIDAASNRGIDEIRGLKDKVNYQPVRGRKKIYIIDEVHMLTKEAFNALLKTLEEPPSHVMFILATTEPEKILDTIISRCQRYDFKPHSYSEVSGKILEIAEKEEIQIDEDSLKLLYEKSGGSMRDAISIFEKLISSCLGEPIVIEKAEEVMGVIPNKKLNEFYSILLENSLESGVKFLDGLWDDSINVEEFFKDFAYFIKDKLLNKTLDFSPVKAITIIEKIFEVISKFKYEEDKRLIGYVILYKIFEFKEEVQVRYVEKEVIKEVPKVTTAEAKELKPVAKEVASSLTIEEVKLKWDDVLNSAIKEKLALISFLNVANPEAVHGNKIIIGFSKEDILQKEMMENDRYNTPFKKVIKGYFGDNIDVSYKTVDKLEAPKKVIKDDFVESVVNFFQGEIIE